MRIIDLSQTMENGMPQYPGQPLVSFAQISSVDTDGYQVTDFHCVAHVGTHCDAPAHFIANGETIETIPLDRFVGEAIIVDVRRSEKRELGAGILVGYEIQKDDIVLFRSGMSEEWDQESYLTDYPYISEMLAQRLVELEVKAIGLDFISPDPIETETFPAHKILLENKLGIVENLKHLHLIDRERIFFAAAPLKIRGSDGAFARAFAIEFE